MYLYADWIKFELMFDTVFTYCMHSKFLYTFILSFCHLINLVAWFGNFDISIRLNIPNLFLFPLVTKRLRNFPFFLLCIATDLATNRKRFCPSSCYGFIRYVTSFYTTVHNERNQITRISIIREKADKLGPIFSIRYTHICVNCVHWLKGHDFLYVTAALHVTSINTVNMHIHLCCQPTIILNWQLT